MKCGSLCVSRILVAGLAVLLFCGSVFAQKTLPSKPINLDRDLNEQTEPNRAASYYHYSLAKWYENNGDSRKALAEMQLALQFNPNSSSIYVEIAILLGRTGNINEAIRNAEEAVRLDPKNPDPHWLLANIYFGAQERGNTSKEGLLKAVRELEILKDLTPEDERIYYNLGGAYFELEEKEKAIQAYEKYQSITNTDAGYREIAKYYERVGDTDKAIEYLNKGLAIDPESSESLKLLGSLYSKQNKTKDAVAVYKRLLGISGNSNASVMQRLAAALFDEGEFQEAASILQELEAKARPNRGSQLLLGRCMIELHRYPEAIKSLQAVIDRVPDDIEARFYLGRAYEESESYGDAAKIYAALLADMPDAAQEAAANRPVFQQRLAAVYLELEEYEKAIALYTEMAKSDPKVNPQLLNALRISRQFDKAIQFGKPLFEKNPNDVQIGIIYARTLADADKNKAGVEILSNLLQLNPENVDIYVNLSEIYRQDKRYADAERILLRGEERNLAPEANERLKFQRASIYERQKDFDRAESLLREMLKANPENATVLNYIGYMLADRGVRLDEAIRYVKEALARDPYNGAYLDSLGWAYFKLNDLQNAENYLLQAKSFVNNDATIDDHLGDLYFKIGNLEKAQDFWMKSIRIGKEPEDVLKVRRKLDSLQETLRKQKSGK